MKTISFFRVAILSLILPLVSCNKESDIDLSIGDLIGTWETEDFEEPPIYGPMTIIFKEDFTLATYYDMMLDDESIGFIFVLSMFEIDSNKIIYDGFKGDPSSFVVEKLCCSTMRLKISNQYMSVTLNAKKIK